MGTLSQMCNLPEGWVAQIANRDKNDAIGMSKKLEWKMAKRKEHDRMLERRNRMRNRAAYGGTTMGSDRRRVYDACFTESMGLESGSRMFAECKVALQPKKAKNRASKEQAGTIGSSTMGVRTGKYGVVVCKVKNIW